MLFSACGDEIAAFALVFRLADRGAWAIALLQAGPLVPGMLLGRRVGRAAQGRRPAPLLVVANLLQAATVTGMAASDSTWLLLLLTYLLGAFGALSATLLNSALPDLLEFEGERAYGIQASVGSLATVAGPMAGVALAAMLGVRTVLIVDGMTFAAFAILLAPLAHHHGSKPFEAEKESNPARAWSSEIFRLVAPLMVVVAATAGTDVAFVYLVRQNLHSSARLGYGLVFAAWAAGMFAGGFVAGPLKAVAARAILASCSGVLGVVYVVYGLWPAIPTLVIASLFGGVANATFNASIRAAIYQSTTAPRASLAFGTFVAAANGAVLVGLLAASGIAEHYARGAYLVGGVLACGAGLAAYRLTRPTAVEAATIEPVMVSNG